MGSEGTFKERMASLGGAVAKGGLVATVVLAAIIIPLMMWYAWSRSTSVLQALSETAFCVSMVWFLISTMKWERSFGKVSGSASSGKLLFGPQPNDLDERIAWRWGRHCRYSFVAMILSMGAFALALWRSGQ